jgi:predicted MFS family arabinose efflux permease
MSDAGNGPNRWAALALLSIAQLMVVLDATIVNIALPSAQKALHFSTSDREWIVTAYALAFGSLLLLGGKLGDLFGRKWTFIVGLAGFISSTPAAPRRPTPRRRANIQLSNDPRPRPFEPTPRRNRAIR